MCRDDPGEGGSSIDRLMQINSDDCLYPPPHPHHLLSDHAMPCHASSSSRAPTLPRNPSRYCFPRTPQRRGFAQPAEQTAAPSGTELQPDEEAPPHLSLSLFCHQGTTFFRCRRPRTALGLAPRHGSRSFRKAGLGKPSLAWVGIKDQADSNGALCAHSPLPSHRLRGPRAQVLAAQLLLIDRAASRAGRGGGRVIQKSVGISCSTRGAGRSVNGCAALSLALQQLCYSAAARAECVLTLPPPDFPLAESSPPPLRAHRPRGAAINSLSDGRDKSGRTSHSGPFALTF